MLNKKYIIIAFITALLSGCTTGKSNDYVSITKAETIQNPQNDKNTTTDLTTTLVNNTQVDKTTLNEEAQKTISIETGTFNFEDLTLLNSTTIDLNLKSPITLKLYCSAAMNENNKPIFDDSNYWALIAETSEGYYKLYDKTFIQLGNIKYTSYFDENNILSILVTESATANYYINNFTYDENNKEFRQYSLIDLDNINKMAESQY